MDREERKRQEIRRKKRQRNKRRRMLKKLLIFVLLAVAATGLWVSTRLLPKKDTVSKYVLQKPQIRTEDEVLSELLRLSQEYEEFQEIYEHAKDYPEPLLAALVNNPEMIDFVKGYPGGEEASAVELTKKEEKEDFPLFLQWDSRWGYTSYGSSSIAVSGCGPTCLSMAAYSLTRDGSFTPDQVAEYSENQGYYIEGTGTSWSLMTDGAEAFGIQGEEIFADESVMKAELDAGRPIICAMAPGDFTAAGHFILIRGYGKDGFKVNDPNCLQRSKKPWSYEELRGQIKNLWAYHKK